MMRKTIDEVLAEAAIRDLQIRYCRAVDRMDWDLLRSCFHVDAQTDYGMIYKGGVDGFIAMGSTGLAAYEGTTHITGNQLVEVRGVNAWAEHYTVATHRMPAGDDGPERDLITAIRYIDQAECRDGDWRIAHRALVLDWWRVDPVHDLAPRPFSQPGARRDRGDPSYRYL